MPPKWRCAIVPPWGSYPALPGRPKEGPNREGLGFISFVSFVSFHFIDAFSFQGGVWQK
jgi:hypothetical protein